MFGLGPIFRVGIEVGVWTRVGIAAMTRARTGARTGAWTRAWLEPRVRMKAQAFGLWVRNGAYSQGWSRSRSRSASAHPSPSIPIEASGLGVRAGFMVKLTHRS